MSFNNYILIKNPVSKEKQKIKTTVPDRMLAFFGFIVVFLYLNCVFCNKMKAAKYNFIKWTIKLWVLILVWLTCLLQ